MPTSGLGAAVALALFVACVSVHGCAPETPSTSSTPEQETPVMETVTSRDGTPIAYWRSGSGPPLVLVHGTTADHTRWAGILPELERDYTVYALDRRGRGGSGDADPYAIEREFEDVAAVVDAIGEPAFLFGHSYGAICALEAALLTENVRKLVLYEPPVAMGVHLYPEDASERIQALVDEGRLEEGLELFFREVVGMPDHEFEVYSALPVWQVRIALAPTIPREMVGEEGYRFEASRFSDLGVPTLLMLGGDSPPLFSEAVDMLRAALPNVRVAVLPGQQHVGMDTAPEMFLAELRGFLAE